VKTVADTLEVARSNLQKPKVPPVRRYTKSDDEWILPMIKEVVADKGSYGYRRVTARLCSLLEKQGKPRVNAKRIYRIMKAENLLLQKHTGKPTQTHEGTIITLKSNLRWCSDAFEIRCWSGEKIQVAFSLDCCDREAMSYVATTGAIDGEMIRDLMLETTERRYGAGTKALPHPVQWLSDNGPPYVSNDTRMFGRNLGLIVCNTPSYSPESNGMAEAFVKTFKRDYVYLNNLYDAKSVLEQLPGWFEDYNERAPHKGLKMKSPREFMRSTQAI
jgi:transposase InsO family protein